MIQDVLHRPAVGELTLTHLCRVPRRHLLAVSTLTFVGVEEEDELLLDQLPFFRICRMWRSWGSTRRSSVNTGAVGHLTHLGRAPRSPQHVGAALGHDGAILVLAPHWAWALLFQLCGVARGQADWPAYRAPHSHSPLHGAHGTSHRTPHTAHTGLGKGLSAWG